ATGSSRLSAADVDRLRVAACAKEAKALVVGTIERVDKHDAWYFYLKTDGPAVRIRVVYGERIKLERRFGSADLAGKTGKGMASSLSAEKEGVELSLTTMVSEGGDANFEVIDPPTPIASVYIRYPVASGPPECDNWRAFYGDSCLAAERRL